MLMNEKLRKVLQPVLQQQTLYQLNQMKSFVDNSLREVISRNFENDSERINLLSHKQMKTLSEFQL